MRLSPRKKDLDSLFKEVRFFKAAASKGVDGVDCWICGNHGKHDNDENHENPGCKT